MSISRLTDFASCLTTHATQQKQGNTIAVNVDDQDRFHGARGCLDCFYYHFWRNNVVVALGTLLSLLTQRFIMSGVVCVFPPSEGVEELKNQSCRSSVIGMSSYPKQGQQRQSLCQCKKRRESSKRTAATTTLFLQEG